MKWIKELEKEAGDRKETVEKLRKYQFMIESAHDAIFFKDLGSHYIIVNDKTLETFGLSREDVIGKNDYELMPDQKEAEKNVYDDQIVFKSEKPTEVIKHMTGVDGIEYWFQAIKVPQFDNEGKVIGLVGIARDITDRKMAEEALLRERDKLKEALAKIKTLSGMLPICTTCKKIRDDKGFWNQIESYIRKHSEAEFSHSICPECSKKFYSDLNLSDNED